MTNKPKIKGTRAESALVGYLKSMYWPDAERRALTGNLDKGDVAGCSGLAWEQKAARTLAIPAWLRETAVEKANSGADYGILVIKPHGVGKVQNWWALISLTEWGHLCDHAILRGTLGHKDIYTFATKIRRMDVRASLNKLALEQVVHETPLNIALYPESTPPFAAMHLSDMVDLLHRAGYGTELSHDERTNA